MTLWLSSRRTNLELELLHLRGHHQAATPSPSTSAATSLARNKSCVGEWRGEVIGQGSQVSGR